MNKLIRRLAMAFVGISMAVGVGVAVASNKNAVPVNAEAGSQLIAYRNTSTTTNMTGGNDAATLGASATDWSVVGYKGGNNNYPGLNKTSPGQIRIYGNNQNYIVITCNIANSHLTGLSINSSQKNFNVYEGSAVFTSALELATPSSNTYTATFGNNVTSFTIRNEASTQSIIQGITVDYDFTPSTFTVTYDANTGTGNVPTDNTKYNDEASVTVLGNVGTPNPLSKVNHAFSGWTLNAEGTGTVYGPGDGQTHTYTIDSANVTFYAKWVDTRTYFDVTTSTNHLLLSGDTHVLQGESAEVNVSADAYWKVPTSISVTGAGIEGDNWSYSNGTLTILEVTGDVSVSASMDEAEISDISVEVDSSETSFYLGHDFTHNTAVVTGIYDDAYLTEEDVTAGCTWSDPDMFTTGNNKTVTVTHTATSLTDTYTISVSNKQTSEAGLRKVTNVSDLTVGSTVYLVCEGKLKQFNGINTSGSTHYGNGTDYTTTPASATYALTVAEGSEDNTIAFVTNEKYLYWNSGNSLDTNATLSNKTSWSVSISDGNATIANANDNSRIIMWNVSSPRFACYTGQNPSYDGATGYNKVQLYKNYPAVVKDLIKITAEAKTATRYIGDTVSASDFTVTAYYDDGTNSSVTATSLTNATLTSMSNVVTVNYLERGITKSANVTVPAVERTAELTGLAWEQGGLTVFEGDELDFSTLGTITAEYDDGDSYATKGIVSCTVGLYSKSNEVYTRVKTIDDGHEFALSENGLYLGVEYTEDAITVKAYSSTVVNVVETINAVYEQEPVYIFSRVTSINSGDVVTFVNEAASKVATSHSSNVINAATYDGDVTTTFTFTVGKVGDYYTFHNANGYLGNHSTGTSGNNYAYLDAEIDEENNQNYFTVAFNGNNVVITSVYDDDRTLQFNSTRFCFYGSNQGVVQLYKGSAGYSPVGINIANTNAIAQKAALDYVDYFNTTMACVNDGSTANVSTKWTAVSGEFTRVLGTLEGDALTNFKQLFAYTYARGSDKYDDADALQDMLAKYNHIVKAHGVEDFLNENPINRPTAQYANTNISGLFGKDSGSTATIIIIISMVSLTAIAGYAILRKRKEQ